MNKGNKLKKLNRPAHQRVSMMRNMAKSLIQNESVVTTQARGKVLSGYFDKLVSIAKRDSITPESVRRLLISELGTGADTERSVDKLTKVLVGKLQFTNSGYCQKHLLEKRSGDNSQQMRVKINFKAEEKPAETTKSKKK